MDPTPPNTGFVDRIKREAYVEAREVVAEAKERADQVAQVLEALKLPLPQAVRVLRELEYTGIDLTPLEASKAPPVSSTTSVVQAQEETTSLPPEPPPPPRGETPAQKMIRERKELEQATLAAMRERLGKRIQVPDILGPINLAVSMVVDGPALKLMLEELARRGEITKGGEGLETYYVLESKVTEPSPPQHRSPLPPPPRRKPPSIPGVSRGPRHTTGAHEETPPPPTETSRSLDLDKYPAAESGGPAPQRLDAARVQRSVHEYVRDTPATAPEAAKALGLKTGRVSRCLYEMGKRGLVQLTGEQRGGAPEFANGDGTPVPDEWPPDLADMPIAETSGKRGTDAAMLVTAMQQKRVVEAVRKYNKPFVAAEFEPMVPFPRSRTIDYLNSLAAQGKYVRRTGKMRRARAQTAGRTAVEYAPVREESSPPSAPAAVPPVEVEAAPHPTQQELVNLTREAMARQEGRFAAHDVREYINEHSAYTVSTESVTTILEGLVLVGSVKGFDDPSTEGRRRYERLVDTERIREKKPSHEPAKPVPGTGRGSQRRGHAAGGKIVASARKILGADKVRETTKNHWLLTLPDGTQVLVSNGGVVERDKAKLRKLQIAL